MQLLPSIEAFIRSRKIHPTRFGRDAVRDPRFVLDLRNGREPRRRTIARVTTYMDDQMRGDG